MTFDLEYISAVPWIQSYQKVIGSLPFDEVKAAVKVAGKGGINSYSLADNNPLKVKIREISQAALLNQGIGVIEIRKTASGSWERTNSKADRRITRTSEINDGHYLKSTAPAKAIFRKTSGQGYVDGLGDRIVATFDNCAGGTTPCGTVLSAEENFQFQIPETVYADGTSFDPKEQTCSIGEEEFAQGNVLGLAGNKYGWIVEIDPDLPDDGTKQT